MFFFAPLPPLLAKLSSFDRFGFYLFKLFLFSLRRLNKTIAVLLFKSVSRTVWETLTAVAELTLRTADSTRDVSNRVGSDQGQGRSEWSHNELWGRQVGQRIKLD